MSTEFETVDFGVSGGTPGADSNTYKLFDTAVVFGAGVLPITGLKRVSFSTTNNAAGTLNAYRSVDGGTTWEKYSTQAIVASTASAINGPYDFLIDTFKDWKLEWVNGGSAQTTWRPELKGHASRTPGT